jgi:hypothetical protein
VWEVIDVRIDILPAGPKSTKKAMQDDFSHSEAPSSAMSLDMPATCTA